MAMHVSTAGQCIMKERPAPEDRMLDVAASAAGWSEPILGRELRPLKSSAFHGALFHQLSANLRKLNLDIY